MTDISNGSFNAPMPPARRIQTVVVEDSLTALQAVADTLALHPRLELAGTARDGVEGQRLVEQLRPDLVISDLNMPRVGGMELVETLRKQFPDLRLVIISTHEGPVWKNLSLTRGANAYVTKRRLGLELDDLVERLFPEIIPSPSTDTALRKAA